MVKYTAVALSLYASIASAQAPVTPPDRREITPAPVTTQSTQPTPRHPAASRDQFFSPVMGINIEGQGLTLPKGVGEEEPIVKPAAAPAADTAPAPSSK